MTSSLDDREYTRRLIVPAAPLRIPELHAIDVLTERVQRGEKLQSSRPFLAVRSSYRQDVLRWHEENLALIDGMFLSGGSNELVPTKLILTLLPQELSQLSGLRERLVMEVGGEERLVPRRASSVVYGAGSTARSDAALLHEQPEAPAAIESNEEALPGPEVPAAESPLPDPLEGPRQYISLETIQIGPAASAALPVYDADSASERDHIGIGVVADAFSYLIASRTSQPPLAIGLFGEWGSGKSFLMSAIKKRVDQITRAARQSDLPASELGVHKRVVQIEFNAWHYVEGNLWASLVDHIFANLRVTPEESSSILETRRKAINEKLASTTAQRELLQQRIARLEKERQDTDSELSSLRAKQRANLEQARKITVGDVAAATRLDDADKQTVNNALGAVGLGTVDDTAVEAVAALSDARDVARHGGAIFAPMHGRGHWWLGLVVLAICAAPVAAFVLQHFNVPTAPKVLTSLAATASVGVALFHNGIKWMATVVGKIESAESAVRARVDQTLAEQARDLAAIQHDIDRTEADLADALGQRQNTQELIDNLKREKTELTPGKILSEFLDARAVSRDYEKHLGLTALIRRDFEELSRLIRAVHDGPDGGIADFSRVVLFVDDLDRCPPVRVVEVLQAVHLLLSFPVFAVVVAVDPRWLSRSLQKHFAGLIEDVDDRAGDMSTAQDYLEKIFQIPYRVGPLDHPAQQMFLRGLLADVVPKASILSPTSEATAPDHHILGDLSSRESESVHPTTDGGPSSDVRSGSFGQHRETNLSPPVEVDLLPSSLELNEHEVAYLDRLLPILDSSPRGLKRYVNIYRLIKTVLSGHEAPTGVPAETAAERRMFMLAVLTSMACGADLITHIAAAASAPEDRTVAACTAEYFSTPRAARHTAEGAVLQDWINGQSLLAAAPAAQVAADARHIRLYSFV